MTVICERVKKKKNLDLNMLLIEGHLFQVFYIRLDGIKGDILALAEVCALLTIGQQWGSKIKMILHVAFSVGLIVGFCVFTAFAGSKKNTEYHRLFSSNTE